MDSVQPLAIARGRQRAASPAVVLFAGMTCANASNYLYQIVMGRMLGSEAFGLLGSLLSFITVAGICLTALQTASAKAVVDTTPDPPARAILGDGLTRTALMWALGAGVVVALASPLIAQVLHGGIAGAALLGLSMAPAAGLALGLGRLQGLHLFQHIALASLGVAVLRLVLSPAAVLAGGGIAGSLLATVVATAAGAWWTLRASSSAASRERPAIGGDVLRAGIALGLFWLMVSIDVPAARATLGADAAGRYAVASVLGKAVLWLPASFTTIMFARVTRLRAEGRSGRRAAAATLGVAAGLSVAGVLALWAIGPFLIPAAFGSQYREAAWLAWQVAAACVPFSLANVILYYHLSGTRRLEVTVIPALLAAGEIAALAVWHGTPTTIVTTLGVTGWCLLGALCLRVAPLWGFTTDAQRHPTERVTPPVASPRTP